jgi:hypothetical protein
VKRPGRARAIDAPLTQLAPGLWITQRPLRVYGVDIGTRMTIVRFRDGRLLVHSPVSLTAHLRSQLDELGSVGFVVAPNRWHHLFVGDYRQAYPEALVFAAPGLSAKATKRRRSGART